MSCESKQEHSCHARLEVNGEQVELNAFVEEFISQTLLGMVKPLRGLGDIETITLKISRQAN